MKSLFAAATALALLGAGLTAAGTARAHGDKAGTPASTHASTHAGAQAGAQAGAIAIDHAWARATAPSARNGAAYFVLTNRGAEADRLVAASSPVAEKAELHTHQAENGVMRMRPVDSIAVAPGGTATLAPGGLHVMLLGLREPLVKGGTFPLTLVFEKAGTTTVPVSVQGAGENMPGH